MNDGRLHPDHPDVIITPVAIALAATSLETGLEADDASLPCEDADVGGCAYPVLNLATGDQHAPLVQIQPHNWIDIGCVVGLKSKVHTVTASWHLYKCLDMLEGSFERTIPCRYGWRKGGNVSGNLDNGMQRAKRSDKHVRGTQFLPSLPAITAALSESACSSMASRTYALRHSFCTSLANMKQSAVRRHRRSPTLRVGRSSKRVEGLPRVSSCQDAQACFLASSSTCCLPCIPTYAYNVHHVAETNTTH